jgi:hypothetical protein
MSAKREQEFRLKLILTVKKRSRLLTQSLPARCWRSQEIYYAGKFTNKNRLIVAVGDGNRLRARFGRKLNRHHARMRLPFINYRQAAFDCEPHLARNDVERGD